MKLELTITTVLVALIGALLYQFKSVPLIGEYVGTFVAVLLIYLPVIVLSIKKRKIDFLDKGLKSYLKSFVTFFIVALLAFPLFFIGAHIWQMYIIGVDGPHWMLPKDLIQLILYQLLLVALPEEFFFRGYFQSTISKMFAKKWRIFGCTFGWEWIITSAVFAITHSIISYQWWHFSIFFPALLFGYLRERTGSITAPILFHAASNIAMHIAVNSYH